MNKKSKFLIVPVVILLVVLFIIGAWLFERWINWTFSYGGKVEQRIEQIEQRLDILEENIK